MTQLTLPRLGFIGAGRVSRCLAPAFARAGYPVTAIASRTLDSARTVASQLENCQAYADPQQVVDTVDLVFLTPPDDQIVPSVNALQFGPSESSPNTTRAWAIVHCSGASPVSLLDSARAQGAATGGFHPLYLFGGSVEDIERIAGCSVTLEAQGTLKKTLIALTAALGCHPLFIPPGKRMLYHAAAHYASSFALCGLAEGTRLWQTLGFSQADALRALLPMLAGTLETARDRGLAQALAGPVSRGDTGIMQAQLDLLEQCGGDHAALYGLLSRRAVDLARERPTPPVALDEIAQMVETSLERSLLQARDISPIKASRQ
ncbi:DUF2520 domain-containing protein [Paraburkholderia bonniea]|uniref:Rossmann-like and DUF2520 domain-containing protein n=1 Tax=Paraburkholderia bonniea TaxID=2152891 RepID=UPI001291A8ED|nr:DUF2520 domain-containing protein [Paraburkholderia bonniea]WJF90909.1 DUF2520 domain-containing protein [Paraburkholderia bonniea]WJF94223.1 DUF2520 domain-containing protein [Paraburkholderia bonniea]